MAGLVDTQIRDSYKSVLRVNDNTNGIDSSLEVVEDGAGTDSPIKVSTTNVTVLDHQVNTQYAYFGTTSEDGIPSANETHYAIPFALSPGELPTKLTLGTTLANPDTTYTVSTTADDLVFCLWYVPDDITVSNVYVWAGADDSGNNTLKFHLMSYDVVSNNSSDGGNLSNGVVVADGDDIASLGYEQAYYQSMTVENPNVDAGQVVLFTIWSTDIPTADYTVNVTVKYHLR